MQYTIQYQKAIHNIVLCCSIAYINEALAIESWIIKCIYIFIVFFGLGLKIIETYSGKCIFMYLLTTNYYILRANTFILCYVNTGLYASESDGCFIRRVQKCYFLTKYLLCITIFLGETAGLSTVKISLLVNTIFPTSPVDRCRLLAWLQSSRSDHTWIKISILILRWPVLVKVR